MSQQKVDAYKARKANRKEEIEKANRKRKLNKLTGRLIAAVCGLGLVVALGVTGWNQYQAYQASKPHYERTEMIVSDLAGVLTQDDTAE